MTHPTTAAVFDFDCTLTARHLFKFLTQPNQFVQFNNSPKENDRGWNESKDPNIIKVTNRLSDGKTYQFSVLTEVLGVQYDDGLEQYTTVNGIVDKFNMYISGACENNEEYKSNFINAMKNYSYDPTTAQTSIDPVVIIIELVMGGMERVREMRLFLRYIYKQVDLYISTNSVGKMVERMLDLLDWRQYFKRIHSATKQRASSLENQFEYDYNNKSITHIPKPTDHTIKEIKQTDKIDIGLKATFILELAKTYKCITYIDDESVYHQMLVDTFNAKKNPTYKETVSKTTKTVALFNFQVWSNRKDTHCTYNIFKIPDITTWKKSETGTQIDLTFQEPDDTWKTYYCFIPTLNQYTSGGIGDCEITSIQSIIEKFNNKFDDFILATFL